jgi:hypothetical protein
MGGEKGEGPGEWRGSSILHKYTHTYGENTMKPTKYFIIYCFKSGGRELREYNIGGKLVQDTLYVFIKFS